MIKIRHYLKIVRSVEDGVITLERLPSFEGAHFSVDFASGEVEFIYWDGLEAENRAYPALDFDELDALNGYVVDCYRIGLDEVERGYLEKRASEKAGMDKGGV